MKKIFYLIIMLALPFYVNAESNEFKDEEIITSEIKYHKTVTNLSKTGNVSLLTTPNSTTVEISEHEYNSICIASYSTFSETTYKKLKTDIIKTGDQYKYQATLTWKNAPKVRSYDILGIGFLPSVTIDGDINFSQKYCKSGKCTTSKTFIGNISTTGCSAVFKLPSNEYVDIEQKISFLVKKNTSYNIISQVAAGDYAHATKSQTKENAKNHTINENGLTLKSSIIGNYDDISPAKATWSGTW